MAEVIATMIQALRMGEPIRARELGMTALAIYASDRDVSVEQLLVKADPHGPALGQRPRVEDDVVLAEDSFEVVDPPHRPPGGLMRAAGFLARLPQLIS